MPKILPEDVSLRTAVREPQLAEQLVEVPTIVSWSLLQLIMKQNADSPVVGGSGAGGGLSGFLPGQHFCTFLRLPSRPLTIQLLGRELVEVFKVFFVDRVEQRFLPIQVEVFKIFSQSRVPQRLLRFLLHTLVLRVFRTFSSSEKSAEVAGQVDEKMPGHVSSSTPAAYEVHHVARDDLWVQIMIDDDEYFWHRQEQTEVWSMPPGTKPGLGEVSGWPLLPCRDQDSPEVVVGHMLRRQILGADQVHGHGLDSSFTWGRIGGSSVDLRTVYEMACFFVSFEGYVAVNMQFIGCASQSVQMTVVVPRLLPH